MTINSIKYLPFLYLIGSYAAQPENCYSSKASFLENQQPIGLRISEQEANKKNIDDDKAIRFIIIENGLKRDVIYQLDDDSVDEWDKDVLEWENRFKVRADKQIMVQKGSKKVRLLWDADFIRKHQNSQLTTIQSNVKKNQPQKRKKFTLKRGDLTFELWCKIPEMYDRLHIDPRYIPKKGQASMHDTIEDIAKKYPQNLYELINHNHYKASGKLRRFRIYGTILFFASWGLEAFFIYQMVHNAPAHKNYAIAGGVWFMVSLVNTELIYLSYCDPASFYLGKCLSHKEYDITFKEPSKYEKVICCIQREQERLSHEQKRKIIPRYRCFFGLFSLSPFCWKQFVYDIKQCPHLLGKYNCLSRLNCFSKTKKLPPVILELHAAELAPSTSITGEQVI